MLNLYTIDRQHLQNQNKIITLDTLQKVFKEWLTCAQETTNTKTLRFKNPKTNKGGRTRTYMSTNLSAFLLAAVPVASHSLKREQMPQLLLVTELVAS